MVAPAAQNDSEAKATTGAAGRGRRLKGASEETDDGAVEAHDQRRGTGSSREDAGAAQSEAAQSYGGTAGNNGDGAAEAVTAAAVQWNKGPAVTNRRGTAGNRITVGESAGRSDARLQTWPDQATV